ncbi:TolC family protein [Paracnuella aquatica]|uniref:TolC family protein n=1 Tax=Paracnuella aquatica TaxID=2268757 RepID=UPI000DEF61A8|nr:TolC family protein [Paracnuella aquatica]RPD51144.1 TolC family protein [Paracnuella aquatica]
MIKLLQNVPSGSWFLLAAFLLLKVGSAQGQPAIGVGSILDSIERKNPVGRMYDADIRSMDAAAQGARSWMPPEVGTGFFMTPYNVQRWKAMPGGMDEGMGSFMVSLQQMIPNRRKLNAESAYMQSMSGAAREQRKAALNDLYAQAKKAYSEWLIIEKKKTVLDENEKVLDFMVKDAEIRYRNGLDQLTAYYKAKAALGNVQQMRVMYENESRQRRITLNTLMNRNTEIDFTIDTAIRFKDYSALVFDSALFVRNRSELKALELEDLTNRLRMESARLDLKPQFGVRFEHMYGFGRQPQQFTLMGMVRLPMVPWASRMTKANIESYRWRSEALTSQRQMIINEARGMATGMRAEIDAKRRQVRLYENNIIPALRNNYKTNLLAYQQNTQELFMLFDAWETLNMTQVEYLDQLQQLLNLQVELERLLEIR